MPDFSLRTSLCSALTGGCAVKTGYPAVFSPVDKSYWLQRICEGNYETLRRLIPELDGLQRKKARIGGEGLALFIRLLERTPYTLTLELSHRFGETPKESVLEPALRVRVFLDARIAEVLGDQGRPPPAHLPHRTDTPRALLDYKWELNYFLQKWLEHCVSRNAHINLHILVDPAACAASD